MGKRIPEESEAKLQLPKRKQLRLPEYDYAQEGAYFITACTRGKACLFGNVVDGDMILNDAGSMVQLAWDAIPVKYPGIETDEFVVMPNHVHGIIVITDSIVLVTGCYASVQIHDDERIHPGCTKTWMETVQWQIMATQLFRTGDTKRTGIEQDKGIH